MSVKLEDIGENTLRLCLAMIVVLALVLASLDHGIDGEMVKIAIYAVVTMGLGEAYILERKRNGGA